MVDKLLEKLAARLNTSEDKLILSIESRSSGQSVTREIWERPPQ
jgi:hypothetical protein